MDQGATLLGQSAFDCIHRFLSWALSFPVLVVCIEGKCIGNVDVTVPGARRGNFADASLDTSSIALVLDCKCG
ncbi:hypothetical protein [Roseomonas sp. HF4]|uniref:hypothetical protein n=1 Tax=Roseomonas sp. HF4 TaxID=2562313 RepID=UPI001F0E6754|nr:hypothetical protein [Roseomonas sp. HF4]